MAKSPNLYSFSDVGALAKTLRAYVLHCQKAGLDRHGTFKVAVSGGSLPNTLAKALLEPANSDEVDFSKWEIFFADERAVPLDHEDSNYNLLKAELLDKIPESLGKPAVHPVDVKYLDDVQEMADQYQESLMTSFAAKDSVRLPIFDLILLGCGPDGHTCSLFPNHELLREADAWVAAISDSPKPPPKRITLTLPVVTHAIKIAFVATGGGKKTILKEIFDSEDGRSLPCGLVNEGGAERVSWFVDAPAVDGNQTLIQAFEWNVPNDQKHYQRLSAALPTYQAIGITSCWLPPGCKASVPEGNGYDIYDLYDLGEFEQKGTRSTKWGSKEDLLALTQKAREMQIGIYWDAVLNHKAGADGTEKCNVVEVDEENRNKEASSPYEIEAWVRFDFPGRGDTYSSQKYHWQHFSGVDYNAANNKKAIYRILGDNKGWSASVDSQQGNADFLMFADIDYSHPEVEEDVKRWGEWIVNECNLTGFRFDAVQHYSERFMNQFVQMLEKKFGKEKLFLVGEFWTGEVKPMMKYLRSMGHKFSLFDSPLLNNFSTLSAAEDADLRTVFDDTLVKANPANAVTLVMNHDTQPGQTVETPVEAFFKPLAYALILLRQDGYPEVFYGDLYGTRGAHAEGPSCNGKLPDLILGRKLYAYGDQEDYFDQANCVGWVRRGTSDRKAGLAVVMSNAGPGQKKMAVGEMHAGEKWTDLLGTGQEGENGVVEIDQDGYGLFACAPKSVSVWVNGAAEGRDGFGKFDSDIYG